MSDPAKYRTKAELEEYKNSDPIEVVKDEIIKKKIASDKELEKIGINIIGIHEILDNLLAPEGLLGTVKVPNSALSDIKLGVASALEHGARDLGQAVIVKSGKIIIKEGKHGTTQMICDSQKTIPNGENGVLVKLKKPNQDRRMDMPTIGPNTILEASKVGLSGVIIQAGETIIVDLENVISVANENGIFVKAINLDQGY